MATVTTKQLSLNFSWQEEKCQQNFHPEHEKSRLQAPQEKVSEVPWENTFEEVWGPSALFTF